MVTGNSVTTNNVSTNTLSVLTSSNITTITNNLLYGNIGRFTSITTGSILCNTLTISGSASLVFSNDSRLSDSRSVLPGSITYTSLSSTFSLPQLQVTGLVVDLANINSTLAQKVNVNDPKLTDARYPLVGSVSTNSLVTGFALTKSQITGLQTDLDTINTSLSGKCSNTDSRLTDARIPIVGSVSTNSLATGFALTKTQVTGLQTDLDTINTTLSGKINNTDSRLTDARIPIVGSVSTNSLATNFTLDKTKVVGYSADVSSLQTSIANINTTVASRMGADALVNISNNSVISNTLAGVGINCINSGGGSAILNVKGSNYAQLYLCGLTSNDVCEFWTGSGSSLGLNVSTYGNAPITFSVASTKLARVINSDATNSFKTDVTVPRLITGTALGTIQAADSDTLLSVGGSNACRTEVRLSNLTGLYMSLFLKTQNNNEEAEIWCGSNYGLNLRTNTNHNVTLSPSNKPTLACSSDQSSRFYGNVTIDGSLTVKGNNVSYTAYTLSTTYTYNTGVTPNLVPWNTAVYATGVLVNVLASTGNIKMPVSGIYQ